MRAVDTNVLVRALVRDDVAQSPRAEALLREGTLYVPITVVLELEWVLRSRYGFTPRRIAQALQLLVALANVTVGERDAVLAAAARAAAGWDFADALHHALSAGCDDFVTLDTTLARQAARVEALSPPVVRL
jgi:predicted nucleic-acid-binding protein